MKIIVSFIILLWFIRFEPGENKLITLVNIGGERVIKGGNNICDGPVSDDPEIILKIMKKLHDEGFNNIKSYDNNYISSSIGIKRSIDNTVIVQKSAYRGLEIQRPLYARMYGPTTGDIVRLGDTELFIEIEKDFTVYGDECKFGGGKVLREGQGQTTGVPAREQLDTVITNAIIVDHTGIFKADIGIKNGYIIGIGKAGNHHMMDGVTKNMIIGVNTEAIAGEGMIVTAGGMDAHVHFICPQICEVALFSGLTTMLGGGTGGPAAGTCATTCTPSTTHMEMMLAVCLYLIIWLNTVWYFVM